MNAKQAGVILIGVLTGLSSHAAFGQETLTVNGKSGPWISVHSGINSAYFYGTGDESEPTIVSSIDGQGIQPGEQLSITYLSGTVSVEAGVWPYVNAAGNPEFVENNNPDNNGDLFPSYYMPTSDFPVYSSELVGTFAAADGDVVGSPFAVGLAATEIVPAGAYQLQLGVEDSLYSDNAGSWSVQVATVPEPSSCVGLLGFSLLLFRRRHTRHVR